VGGERGDGFACAVRIGGGQSCQASRKKVTALKRGKLGKVVSRGGRDLTSRKTERGTGNVKGGTRKKNRVSVADINGNMKRMKNTNTIKKNRPLKHKKHKWNYNKVCPHSKKGNGGFWWGEGDGVLWGGGGGGGGKGEK